MTHVLLWLLLYPLVAAATTATDARLSGVRYDDSGARRLMWTRVLVYVIGAAILLIMHYS